MKTDEYILFSAGDLMLCAVASAVHCIHDSLTTQKEAGTHSWFEGIAVVDGRLLPITDLGAYYGRNATSGRVLEVAHNLGIAGLRVDDIMGVSNEYDENVHQLIDVAQLVQSPKFLDIQS